MKKYYFLIIVALILGLVLTGCSLLSNVGQVPTSEQSGIAYLTKGSSFTVGNDTTVRTYTDSYTDFTIIDTNHPSSYLGLLDTFSYYAANTNQFKFVLVDGDDVVKWVSEAITPSSSPSAQSWTPLTPVYVEPGWNLGLYFASTGTVPFELVGEPAWYEPNNAGLPVVGDTLSYQGSSNRTYSFVASGKIIEPEVTTSLSGPPTVDVGEDDPVPIWTITIRICPSDVNLNNVIVQGGIGADLVITHVNGVPVPHPMPKKTEYSVDEVTLNKKGGKMGATIVTWYIDDFDSTSSCKNLMLTVETGLNPKLKQEFTSTGPHELDGGFSATYTYLGIEYETPETELLTVEVVE